MVKARTVVRLKEATGLKKSANRSHDLLKLTDDYNSFSKKLKVLITVLRQHRDAMLQKSKTQLAVAQCLGDMTRNSPLFEHTGLLPNETRPVDSVCSFLSVHQGVVTKTDNYLGKYVQHVINYVIEWDKVLTERVTSGLRKAEQLRIDLEHYQNKVESMRQNANVSMAKGKSIDAKSQDKLQRNEEKFMKSKQEYNRCTSEMCILIEEVTERSWRDLHPLLVKIAQFDMTMADDQSKQLAALSKVVNEYKGLANKHGLKPEARLKDLQNLKPEMLTTKTESNNLAIEAGGMGNGSSFTAETSPDSTSGSGTFALTDMQMPPGSVAPQGLGGFPVQLSEQSTDSSSFGGYIKPSPTDELALRASAAPPPTLDQLTDSQMAPGNSGNVGGYNNFGYGSGSAPSSGGLPPLGPPSNRSITDDASVASGYSNYSNGGYSNYSGFSSIQTPTAAPSGAPPPPPLGLPPPPPGAPPPPPGANNAMNPYNPNHNPYNPNPNQYNQNPYNSNQYNQQQLSSSMNAMSLSSSNSNPYSPNQGFGPPPPMQQNPYQQGGTPTGGGGGGIPLQSTNPFDF